MGLLGVREFCWLWWWCLFFLLWCVGLLWLEVLLLVVGLCLVVVCGLLGWFVGVLGCGVLGVCGCVCICWVVWLVLVCRFEVGFFWVFFVWCLVCGVWLWVVCLCLGWDFDLSLSVVVLWFVGGCCFVVVWLFCGLWVCRFGCVFGGWFFFLLVVGLFCVLVFGCWWLWELLYGSWWWILLILGWFVCFFGGLCSGVGGVVCGGVWCGCVV